MSQVPAAEAAAPEIEKRLAILLVYKTIAYVTGVGLIILVFVGIPLQVWAHSDGVVAVVGTLHGFLYVVYVIVALGLSLQARFNPIKTALVVLAGTVPFCAFVAEHFIAKQADAAIRTNRARAKARRQGRPGGPRPRPTRPATRPAGGARAAAGAGAAAGATKPHADAEGDTARS
jgi:integral membrane protein